MVLIQIILIVLITFLIILIWSPHFLFVLGFFLNLGKGLVFVVFYTAVEQWLAGNFIRQKKFGTLI